jgi:nucleoside-triphosphatase THEP1
VIVDEIGPVELELGLGFAPFIARLAAVLAQPAAPLPLFVLTVRAGLAARLAERLPPGAARIARLAEENRDHLPAELARFF